MNGVPFLFDVFIITAKHSEGVIFLCSTSLFCCCCFFFFILLCQAYTPSFHATVNCSGPTVPGNGSFEPYQNTTESAMIFFRCDPGFVPAGRMVVVCGTDGRWSPDPATLVCMCELIW